MVRDRANLEVLKFRSKVRLFETQVLRTLEVNIVTEEVMLAILLGSGNNQNF